MHAIEFNDQRILHLNVFPATRQFFSIYRLYFVVAFFLQTRVSTFSSQTMQNITAAIKKVKDMVMVR